MQSNAQLSVRSAAKIYDVPEATLRRRRAGRPARRDCVPKTQKLTESEEGALVKYILELDSRAFPPRPSGVEDMANRLLAERDAGAVGKCWVERFVKRRAELGTRWIRKYDYQRAKCEDPKLVSAWFDLVRNTVAKYGILDDDIYNFDETGFLMGMIAAVIVITTSEGRGKAKLVQPGNREWATVIQGVNCCGWAIPPFIIVKGQYCHGRIILDMREGNDLLAPIDEDSMVRREGSILHDGGEHGGVLWLSSSHVTYLPALLPEPSHYPALKVQFGKKN
ncbi:hypothetical protein RB600_001915 [Gaeumannomyces tritici]